ncbi:hypothetical protein CD798_03245 [Bacillaceae bacterium SAOS 7]|nr:hypothetical protein CD798_03245 [Bacillaceae bacterium SAOS 7]
MTAMNMPDLTKKDTSQPFELEVIGRMLIFKKLKQSIEKSSFVRSVSILAAGTALSHLFIFLSTPILTHLYTPEEFGVLSVYLAILYSVTSVASLLYEQAIPLPKDEDEGFHLLVLSLVIVIFMSMFVLMGGLILPLDEWFHIPELKETIWLLAISLLGIGWFQAFNSWAIRQEEYKVISKSKVSMNTGQVVSQISLGLYYPSYLGLLVGEVVGRISGFLSFWTLLKNKNMPSFKRVTLKGLKNVTIRYKKFPLISSWSAVINSAGVQMPTFFLAATYGAETAGLFLLAQKILTVPEGLLGYSVSQVYLSQSAQHFRSSPDQFSSLFWKTLKKMAIVSFIIIGLIIIIAPFLISLVFGEEWTEAGKYLQVLSMLYFFRMVVKPIGANFHVLEYQQYEIISEVIRFLLICLSMLLSYLYIESPAGAILCICLLTSIGYIVYGFFAWLAMKKRLRTSQAI